MGLFGERWPYTNLHDLNLDWLIRTCKEISEKFPTFESDIDKKINKPEYDPFGHFGEFLMSNGDGTTKWESISESYREEIINAVDEWLVNHPEATTTVLNGSITTEKFNNEVYTLPFDYPCNIIAEFPTSNIQGACWIENNKYVFASPMANNMCRLYEWDNSLNSIIGRVDVQGYHANSIAFDPVNRYLYIADCIDESDNLLNTITVIAYDTMTFVRRITAPVESVYSIAYAADTQTFYSTNYRGTTEGQANILTEYNGVFDSVKRQITLDDLSVRYDIHHSGQGVQCVKNGIAYIPYYSPSRTIVGFDIETGNKIIVANIPEYLNNYKYTGELEALTYNAVNDSFIVFASGKAFEIGLYKSIPIDNLYFNTQLQTSIYANCYIDLEKDYSTDTKPVTKTGGTEPTFRTIYDAVNAGKNMHKALNIILKTTTAIEYSEVIEIEDFNFRLNGSMSGSTCLVSLKKYISLRRCNALISNLKFTSANTLTSNGASIDVRNSMAFIQNVQFQNSNASWDIVTYFGSFTQTIENTYVKGILNSNGACLNALEPDRPNIQGSQASVVSNFKTNKTVDVYDLDTYKGTTTVETYVIGNVQICKFNNTLPYTFNTMMQLRGFDGMVVGGSIYVNDDYGPETPIQANLSGGKLFLRPNVTGTNIKLYGFAIVLL